MLETLFSALSAKVAAGAVSAVTAAGLVAGATGQLPDAMQDGLSEAAARVGISVPAGSHDQSVDTTDQHNTEEINTEEVETHERGDEDRSDAVRSVIDEYHGEPGEFGKSQSQSDDPSAFGRAVSDAASEGRASEGREAGTDVADDKRPEQPAAADEASRPSNPPADVPANEASDPYRPQDPPVDAGEGQRSDSVERPTRP